MAEKAVWKTLRFRMRVKSIEFEVLADALAGEIENSARMNHGCERVMFVETWVNNKLVDFRKKGKKANADR